MASVIDQLSAADVAAVSNKDADAISPEGVALLSELSAAQFQSLFGENSETPPPPPLQNPPGMHQQTVVPVVPTKDADGQRINDLGTFRQELAQQGPFMESVAALPIFDFAAGVGRGLESTRRGLAQIASTEEEALALGKIEEEAIARYREVWDDEGIGAEDVGEAALFLGGLGMAIPAAVSSAPVAGAIGLATNGVRALNALKALPASLGGQSLIAGLVEGSQATVTGEDRSTNAATASGQTLIGGLGFKAASGLITNSFREGVMGKAMAALGASSISKNNAARARFSSGIAGWLNRKLFGNRPVKDDLVKTTGGVAANAEKKAQQLQAQGAVVGAKAAKVKKAEDETVNNWEVFQTLVAGPRGKPRADGSFGKRRATGGLAGKKPSTTFGDDALGDADLIAQRNRMVNLLTTSAQREGADGKIGIDWIKLGRAWRNAKVEPNFMKVYGVKSKSGNITLGPLAQKVENFIEDGVKLTNKKVESGAAPLEAQAEMLQRSAEDFTKIANHHLRSKRVRDAAATPETPEVVKRDILSGAAGATFNQLQDQNLIEEQGRIMEEGDWMAGQDWMDSVSNSVAEWLQGDDFK